MNSSSVDIKAILEYESSIGLVFGTNLFIGREPAKPDNCVTIYDTPSYGPDLTMDKQSYERPSIQIRVRNENYVAGWTMIQHIMDHLHGRAQETWNGTLYSLIACSGGPALLDWDENNRVRFILNLNLQRR